MVLDRAAALRIRQCAPYVRSLGDGFEVRIVPRVCKRGSNGCWIDWRSVRECTQRFAVQARSVATRPCPNAFDKALRNVVKMVDLDDHKSTASAKSTPNSARSDSAYARTPYELIPYDVSYGVSHTGSLGAFTNFKRASKSFTNLHKI